MKFTRQQLDVIQKLENKKNIIQIIKNVDNNDFYHVIHFMINQLLQEQPTNETLVYSNKPVDNNKLKVFYSVLKYILRNLKSYDEIRIIYYISRLILASIQNQNPSNDRLFVLSISILLNFITTVTPTDFIEFMLPTYIDDIIGSAYIPEFPEIPFELNQNLQIIDFIQQRRDNILEIIFQEKTDTSKVIKLNSLLITQHSQQKNSSQYKSSDSISLDKLSSPKNNSLFDPDGYINFQNFLKPDKSAVDGPSMQKTKYKLLYDIPKYRDNPNRIYKFQNIIKNQYIQSKVETQTVKYDSSTETPWKVLERYYQDKSNSLFLSNTNMTILQKKRLIIEDTNNNVTLDYGGVYKDFMTKVIEHIQDKYLVQKNHSNNYVINPNITDDQTLHIIGFVLCRMLIDNFSFTVPLSWSFMYILLNNSFNKKDAFVLYFLDAKENEIQNMSNICNDNTEVYGGVKRKLIMKSTSSNDSDESDKHDSKKQKKINTIANEYCSLESIFEHFEEFISMNKVLKIKEGCFIPSRFLKSKKTNIGTLNCQDIKNILCSSVNIKSSVKYMYDNDMIKFDFKRGRNNNFNIIQKRIAFAILRVFKMSERKFNDLFKIFQEDVQKKQRSYNSSFSSASVPVDLSVKNNLAFQNSLIDNMIDFRNKYTKNRYEHFLKSLFHFWTGSKTINRNEKLFINLEFDLNGQWHEFDEFNGFGLIKSHTCNNTLDVNINPILGNDEEEYFSENWSYIKRDRQIRNYQARFVALVLYCDTPDFQNL